MPDTVHRLNAVLEGRYLIEPELDEGGVATGCSARDKRHNLDVAPRVRRKAERAMPEPKYASTGAARM
jgi:hypothetical protein